MPIENETIIVKVQGEICEAPEHKPCLELGTINIVENVSFLDRNKFFRQNSSNQRDDFINPVKSLSDQA